MARYIIRRFHGFTSQDVRTPRQHVSAARALLQMAHDMIAAEAMLDTQAGRDAWTRASDLAQRLETGAIPAPDVATLRLLPDAGDGARGVITVQREA